MKKDGYGGFFSPSYVSLMAFFLLFLIQPNVTFCSLDGNPKLKTNAVKTEGLGQDSQIACILLENKGSTSSAVNAIALE